MPRREKLSPEGKVDLAHRCIAGEIGVREAGREASVDKKIVRRWVTRYQSEGVESFLPRERNRVYSTELKLQAVLEYLSGKGNTLKICQRHKISNPCLVEQ